ncbi:MAG: response regulator [Candidatus Latescibacteria bacterium]|nr:response regulator [Candidatus Latescibacterota bacterium]NIO56838.1 response regulator [Candidatus Latescibacterota bacterium]
MTARILIAHDHTILRECLREMLRRQPAIEVVGEASDGRSAVSMALELQPDLVIMEAALPELNGVEATRQITSHSSNIKVLGLSLYSGNRPITQMLNAGASAYLTKECTCEELLRAVDLVLTNQVYLSSSATDEVVKGFTSRLPTTDPTKNPVLSPKEREVLQLLTEGMTTNEIAGVLSTQAKTVETYRKQIMDKLGLHSIAELTKYAIREGITFLSL